MRRVRAGAGPRTRASRRRGRILLLSRSAEYAIRALTYVHLHRSGAWALSREIAGALGIPAPFLAKILRTLAEAGLLESQRGRGGGYRLACDPRRTTLWAIVDPFDRLGAPRICILGQRICSDETACPLHRMWKRSHGAFLRGLETTRLSDVEPSLEPGAFPMGPRSRQRATRGVRRRTRR